MKVLWGAPSRRPTGRAPPAKRAAPGAEPGTRSDQPGFQAQCLSAWYKRGVASRGEVRDGPATAHLARCGTALGPPLSAAPNICGDNSTPMTYRGTSQMAEAPPRTQSGPVFKQTFAPKYIVSTPLFSGFRSFVSSIKHVPPHSDKVFKSGGAKKNNLPVMLPQMSVTGDSMPAPISGAHEQFRPG